MRVEAREENELVDNVIMGQIDDGRTHCNCMDSVLRKVNGMEGMERKGIGKDSGDKNTDTNIGLYWIGFILHQDIWNFQT